MPFHGMGTAPRHEHHEHAPLPPEFLPGLGLSRRLYTDAVRPLLEEATPGVPHSAARLGSGSDVLGYDTPRTVGPAQGLRLQLFLRRHDVHRHTGRIRHVLAAHLPRTFHGRPVGDGVEVTHIAPWFTADLGFDPTSGVTSDITSKDWLSAPAPRLAGVTAGAVFHDGLGELARLHWYPREIWLQLLARHWQDIREDEPSVPARGEAGDELGSAVVAAHLAHGLMRLCLLLHRHYPPDDRWLAPPSPAPPRATTSLRP